MKLSNALVPAPAHPLPPYRPEWIQIGRGLVDLNALCDFAAVLPKSAQLEGPMGALMLGRAGW